MSHEFAIATNDKSSLRHNIPSPGTHAAWTTYMAAHGYTFNHSSSTAGGNSLCARKSVDTRLREGVRVQCRLSAGHRARITAPAASPIDLPPQCVRAAPPAPSALEPHQSRSSFSSSASTCMQKQAVEWVRRLRRLARARSRQWLTPSGPAPIPWGKLTVASCESTQSRQARLPGGAAAELGRGHGYAKGMPRAVLL